MHFPRSGKKNRIKVHAGTGDIYKYYCDTYGNKHNLKRADVSRICGNFNMEIMKKIVYENHEFKMPRRLGSIYVVARKIKLALDEDGNLIKKYLKPNWFATKELWQEDEEARENKTIVYHFNEHFDRKIAGYYWSKHSSYFKNKSYYSFSRCRAWKIELKNAIKNEDIDVAYSEQTTRIC